MGEHVGAELELEVSNVAHGGVFVTRHEGRVVFVADTLPGERVRARVVDDAHDRFWRADTIAVLTASPDRQEHVWAEAAVDRAPGERAGGAEFGHIRPGRQRELKRQVLEENLRRMAGVDRPVPVAALPGPEDGTGWRTRVRLHADEDGRVGPYAARSHRVVEVADLPLATEGIRAVAPLGHRLPGAQGVQLIHPSTGGARLLPAGEDAGEAITERVGEREFRLDAGGFWQVHVAAAATLSDAVSRAVDGQLFDPAAANLDLYGGVGLLAAAVGDRFGPSTRITSVESSPRATEHAHENLADWVGATAVTARVDRYLSRLAGSASKAERARLQRGTVVLDPPRSGAGKDVVRSLAALGPAQLIYVACDPVALARDLGALVRNGYEVTSLEGFDLFPNTHHVEAVAALVRT
ncbi:class I SAM-dependent RNA methyltransferase [Naasia aerilata]|uniref:SAM-dependent methyltransferase n=1 Tax=Naasia aerilata TaxID=1162966 RepID=A0ABN6XLM3_9MICO|nr:class I SAM-dependent RNA methyltransferase [Naasia aerilata]BDZ45867.1 SAM-dependent methyltransferase [Naasia aerilata]